ncbi:MAG: rhomboid family intramembrane serine protease [Roseobacter sp.]
MFPIRDHNPSGRKPYVTYGLLITNVVVFLSYVAIMNDVRALNAFWQAWAFTPSRLSEFEGYRTLVTYMFLHGGWLHLAGNMLFLWIFGDNIEDVLGHGKFLAFYFACGVIAALSQYSLQTSSDIPIVGASGAVAGIMGGYFLLFPKAKVDILIILIVFFRVLPMPAWIVLAVWIGMQFVGGLLADPDEAGVAYWAHAGGFIAGILLIIPVWISRGGTGFWNATHGHPPHPEASYRYSLSRIPKVSKK